MNKLFYIETYGCKLNQLDTERVRNALHAAGFTETDDPEVAELIVVNSCAVTGNAEKESRYRLRRLQRANPDARKYFIGCFTETQNLPDTVFLRGEEKFQIQEMLGHLPSYPDIQEKHVRPLVHIQNGCDLNCTYCIVPYFRGPSRSIPRDEILDQVKAIIHAGRKEAVLTGIHLGTWGKDLTPMQHFLDLLRFLEKHAINRLKIRISSLDSNEISDDLVEHLQNSETIQPHFHIPLQSGSASVLKRMKRRYSPNQFLSVVKKLHGAVPEACLGADVIVGFPGETDEEFKECFNFISRIPLDYLHVFPFSPRTGTPAATMPDQVPEPLKRERVKQLKTLSDDRRKLFARRFIGKHRKGILIYPDLVLTDNYISVHLNTSTDISPGSEIRVKPTHIASQGSVHGILL